MRQDDQVLDPEERPPTSEYQERVRPLNIGPGCRQRTNAIFARLPEEHPVLAPGVRVAHQFELATRQRVEGVDDPKSLRTVSTTCS